jgi:hypothetical protein
LFQNSNGFETSAIRQIPHPLIPFGIGAVRMFPLTSLFSSGYSKRMSALASLSAGFPENSSVTYRRGSDSTSPDAFAGVQTHGQPKT